MPRLRHLVTLTLLLVAACGPAGGAPTFSNIEDQVAYVGAQYSLVMRASDPDGDALTFGFDSNIADLDQRAELRPMGASSAEFVWTPRANDEGTQTIDFKVSDGKNTTTESVIIEVKATEGSGAPIFRKPLGTGSTLDLDAKDCLELDVLLQDDDSTSVTIEQAEPVIDGATLDQTSQFEGTWKWCPTPDQVSAQQNYTLTLTADDMMNPKTIKRYAIYLYKMQRPNCPGEAPVIDHTPEDITSVQSLVISARVTDDVGLKEEPVVHWSLTPPSDPPDLGAMQVAPTIVIDQASGDYAAEIPNPVAAMPAGSTATVYYVITATDSDDTVQDCAHTAFAPASGSYQMLVTAGGASSTELCQACDADAQCGDDDDNCIQVSGEFFCGRSCSSDTDCPADYKCSLSSLTSVDGAVARQCFPRSFSCDNAPTTCSDDSFEDNDTRALAATKPALGEGSHSLVSCPIGSDDDEDWFKITVGTQSRVQIDLAGQTVNDLDVALVTSDGSTLDSGSSNEAVEHLDTCVDAGTYFIHVYAFGDEVRNAYDLTWTGTDGCAGVCTSDDNEPDDEAGLANTVSAVDLAAGYGFSGSVCPQNEDWYAISLSSGQTLHASLAFAQDGSGKDLDFNLYQGTTNLFPCDEDDFAGCDDIHGSGSNANENLIYTAGAAGTYYVVVRGFSGSANDYDLCLGTSATACPELP
jgi:hypothetical protein